MQLTTDDAKSLKSLLTEYQEAGADPLLWLQATTKIVSFAAGLRKPKNDEHHVITAFEIGLVMQTHSATFIQGDDPVATVVWQLLYKQAIDSRAAAGESAPYIEAFLKALGADKAVNRSTYALCADLLYRTLDLMETHDKLKLEVKNTSNKPAYTAARDLLTSLARLLQLNEHNVVVSLQRVKQLGMSACPLIDVAFFDWSWGVTLANVKYKPREPAPPPEPNRPLSGDEVVWRDKNNRQVGAPLVTDGRIILTRFNLDVLLNLSVWKLIRETDNDYANDFKKLWASLAKQPDLLRGELDQIDSQPLLFVEQYVNADVRETSQEHDDWRATKSEWQRRKDILEGGYALRYWAANSSFLDYLFHSWGWLSSPIQTKLQPVTSALPHVWPVVPTIAWLAGRQEELKPEERLALGSWWNEFSGSKNKSESALDDQGSGKSSWHKSKAEWITIGATEAGKTWLDMAVLHITRTPFLVGTELNLSRDAGGKQFYEKLYSHWAANNREETPTDHLADITLVPMTNTPMTQVTITIRDTSGADYDLNRLWNAGEPTPIFHTVVAPRLRNAGLLSIAIDCERLLWNRKDSHAETEKLLLRASDNSVNAEGGTPIALVLTKADKLGLTEPFDKAATVLDHSLPPDANVDMWLDDYFRRPDSNRRLQSQFVAHRLRTNLRELMQQTVRGPVNGNPVNRLCGVFLTCGLSSVIAGLPPDQPTGVAAYLSWAALQIHHRWRKTLNETFARDVREGIQNVLARVRKIEKDLTKMSKRFDDIFSKFSNNRVVTAYNGVIGILNQTFKEGLPTADDAAVINGADLARALNGVKRYSLLVKMYQDAAKNLDKISLSK